MDYKLKFRNELNRTGSLMTGLFLVILLTLSSCKDDSFWDINGPVISETRQLNNFEIINLNNNINLTFVPDTSNFIIITAEEKLLPQIESTVLDDSLYLANLNKDYRLRNYEHAISAELHLSKSFKKFYFSGSGDITNSDTLFLSSCKFIGIRSSGKIDLLINADSLKLGLYVFQNSSDFKISGHTQFYYFFTRGTGISDLKDLIAAKAQVYNQGTNDCFVNVSEKLFLEIQNTGNIYYKGSALLSVKILKNGEGNAIQY